MKNPLSNANFKHWFGNSVTIDGNTPKIFYHGTGGDFNEFKIGRTGAIWFAESTDASNKFSTGQFMRQSNGNPNTIPVFLRIEKPYYWKITKDEKMVDDYYKLLFSNSFTKTQQKQILKRKFENFDSDMFSFGIVLEQSRKFLQKYGYDAIVIKNDTGDNNWGVFDPNQIKSAIGNNGNFSKNSNDITENKMKKLTNEQINHLKVKLRPIIKEILLERTNNPNEVLKYKTIITWPTGVKREVVNTLVGPALWNALDINRVGNVDKLIDKWNQDAIETAKMGGKNANFKYEYIKL